MVYGILFFLLIGVTLEVANKSMGMARITLGSVVNGISGSIDQMVYSTWKGINYIRSKAKTSQNSQSVDQTDVRARTTELSKHWNTGLSQAERDAWETYAQSLPTSGSAPGDITHRGKGPWSGFTAFVRNNQLGFSCGIYALGAFIEAAPIGQPAPDAPSGIGAVFAADTITVTWVEGAVVGARCRVWMRSQTIRGIHPQLVANAVADALTIDLTFIKGRMGKTLLFAVAPGLYDIQCDIVSNDGQVSPPSTVFRGLAVA